MRLQPAIDVSSLYDVPLPQLLALLSAEREQWARELSWDVGDLADAVEQAARCGVLPGVAVSVGGQVVGYLSYHVAPDLLRLCGVHLRPDASADAAAALVGAALATPSARDRRVEGQLMAFGLQPALDAAFRANGGIVVPRSYLVRRLKPADRRADVDPVVNAFDRTQLHDCARVLVSAHAGGVEAAINSAFRDGASALAYLREIVKGAGCGMLNEAASGAITEDGRVVGFCLVTTIAPGVGHVPQVAVQPSSQGSGRGAALLGRALSVLAGQGYELITLGVSRDNARAAALYGRLGFGEGTRFSAYYRDPGPMA